MCAIAWSVARRGSASIPPGRERSASRKARATHTTGGVPGLSSYEHFTRNTPGTETDPTGHRRGATYEPRPASRHRHTHARAVTSGSTARKDALAAIAAAPVSVAWAAPNSVSVRVLVTRNAALERVVHGLAQTRNARN